MDEVHRAVGLQKVAPCPRAGMRLARDEQHAQAVAHAVHGDDRGVVAVGQLAFERRGGELDHVLSAVGQCDRHGQLAARGHLNHFRLAAVDRDRQVDQPAFVRVPHVVDAQPDLLFLVQNAERRGVGDHQPPVPILFPAGHEQMQRGGQVGRGFKIVQAAVRDQDHSGDAVARHFGQRLGQGGHEERAAIVFAVAHPRDAQFQTFRRRNAGGERVQRRLGLLRPVRQALRGAFVHDGEHDVTLGRAFFHLKRRPREREQERRRAQHPKRPALEPAPDGEDQDRGDDPAGDPEDRPVEGRVEDDGRGVHWPSLSSRAGTWT